MSEIAQTGDLHETTNVDEFEWDVDAEIQLFYAMFGHKPVGINKYFNMMSIWEKLTHSIGKEITSESIWKHLETLYDLNMLDDTEPLPFPSEEVEFSLPETEFGELIRQKIKEGGITVEEPEDRSASPKIQSTPRSVSRGTASRENTPKANWSRLDPRRDSRDSNASVGRESTGSTKGSTKSTKSTKAKERTSKSRSSLSTGDDGVQTPDPETSSGSKKGGGTKRPTRGSIARIGSETTPQALTPPSARRRRI